MEGYLLPKINNEKHFPFHEPQKTHYQELVCMRSENIGPKTKLFHANEAWSLKAKGLAIK